MSELESAEFKSEEERRAALKFEREQEYEESVEQEKPRPFDAVIVLGGGLDDPLWKKFQGQYGEGENPRGVKIEKSEGWMLPFDVKMRTIAAAQMYLEGLTREIVFTGGKTATGRGIEASEAEKMKEYARHLMQKAGIKDEEIDRAIILEDKATNTIENVANVCNIIDQNPEEYQNLAILSNEYHLDRAQELLKKFNLEAESVSAEEKLRGRSEKYQKVLDRFFESPGYQTRLAGERRWAAGLKEIPRYWFPQAMAVENPERLYQIMESIYGPAFAQKMGKEAVLKSREQLKQTKRAMPPEGWGKERH